MSYQGKKGLILCAGSMLPTLTDEYPKCCAVLQKHGLELSAEQYDSLQERRQQSLLTNGRIEFNNGIILPLIQAFCGSPYLHQHNCTETLADLQDIFYQMKNAAGDLVEDYVLLEAMRSVFDHTSHGDITRTAEIAIEMADTLGKGGRI